MNNHFEGQVAIITGAGIGIGFEIARQLAAAGATVLLNDLDTGRANQAVGQIQSEGGRAVAMPGDASDLGLIQALVDFAGQEFGRLDIAIANAGITTYGDFFDYSFESFQRLVSVNLQGSFFLAQSAAKQMRAQGHGGRILFMSSVTGHQSHRYLATYGMTKAGLEMLAKGLVLELAPHGITVNAIAPGATLTERTQLESPDYPAIWSRITPTGRASTPADIAHAALFLVSPQAAQVTGQTLVVDGGWTAVSPEPTS